MASLLMMAGANPAAVQRIMRHSDPKLTTEVYGHLAPGYLRAEVDRLSFGIAPSEPAKPQARVANLVPFVPPLSPNGAGTVVPLKGKAHNSAAPLAENQWALQDSNLGPIGYEQASESVQPFATAAKGSDSFAMVGESESNASQQIGSLRTNFVPALSPSFRAISGGVSHLLTVREVAALLSVCRATIYALCDRGELPHIRISNAIRVALRDLAEFIADRRSG